VDKEQPSKRPGDILPLAKKQGLDISLKDVTFATSNIILLISISAFTVNISWLIRPKIKLRLENKRIETLFDELKLSTEIIQAY
jgi:hypothetical protein